LRGKLQIDIARVLRLQILQVSAYYPPHLGGQEVVVQELATCLANMGEQVEVVTSDLGASAGTIVENGLRVSRLKSAELGHTAIIWGLFWWLLRHTRRDTVVHLHVGQAFTPEVVWLASRFRRFKFVMHMHIDPAPSGPLGRLLSFYKALALGPVLRAAHIVVVLNEHHGRVLRSDYRFSGKLLVMANGIDKRFFDTVRKPRSLGVTDLLFVGRLSPQKNLSALLEAVGAIDAVTLDIVGDGECRRELAALIRDRGLKNVTLHGELDRRAIRELYATRSALILPSLYEAQPVVLLEAMASRIPIIASNVVGIDALARGVAVLVDTTPTGIADGVNRFAAMSYPAREAMAEAAFRRVQGRSWSALIGSYMALYEQLAGQDATLPAP
jgi:glycosyltransferase involved in cell wall biosynthesis